MMNKNIRFVLMALAVSVALGVSLVTLQAKKKKYGSAGCGLGSIVVGPEGPQVFASTTNWTGSQTFGITSGTSNCDSSNQSSYYHNEQEIFVTVNYNALALEMASGQGEKLEAFANILGCPFASEFINFSRRQHQALFQNTSAQDDARMFMTTLRQKINANHELKDSCHRI